MKNYFLVIHSPFNLFDTLAELKSDTPFLTVSRGDLIDPDAYELDGYKDLESKLLRVVDVQHFITLTDNLQSAKHRIDIFTEVATGGVIVQRITREDTETESDDDATKNELAELLGISPDELPDKL